MTEDYKKFVASIFIKDFKTYLKNLENKKEKKENNGSYH